MTLDQFNTRHVITLATVDRPGTVRCYIYRRYNCTFVRGSSAVVACSHLFRVILVSPEGRGFESRLGLESFSILLSPEV